VCSLGCAPVYLSVCWKANLNKDDTPKDAEALAKKILGLRLFNDELNQQMWKRSVKDVEGEILCGSHTLQALPNYSVSQFTLHAVTAKGTKPDFHSIVSSRRTFN
jgi:D-aminoacyl-tRNA deacylase